MLKKKDAQNHYFLGKCILKPQLDPTAHRMALNKKNSAGSGCWGGCGATPHTMLVGEQDATVPLEKQFGSFLQN